MVSFVTEGVACTIRFALGCCGAGTTNYVSTAAPFRTGVEITVEFVGRALMPVAVKLAGKSTLPTVGL